MKIACVIPARLKSTRFPKKMLTSIQGKPLLQWVWEAALKVSCFDEVIIAVDARETAELVESFGGIYQMTSEACQSGTERLVELEKRGWSDADIWVNWQGDEPFIHQEMIRDLLQTCHTEKSDVWTLCKQITKQDEIHNPHVAKVVFDQGGHALYFSRSTIPYYRDPRPEDSKKYYKHIGLYAFTRAALQKMQKWPSCELEGAEQLEQLRFLYQGLKIRMHQTTHDVFGIDLPEHLEKAETFLLI